MGIHKLIGIYYENDYDYLIEKNLYFGLLEKLPKIME